MASIATLADFRTPARQTEAHIMSQLRTDCERFGLSPEQTQRVLKRARDSLHSSANAPDSLRPTMEAVLLRGKHDGHNAAAQERGLFAAIAEWIHHSAATAIQAGYRAMRPQAQHGSDHGPTAA